MSSITDLFDVEEENDLKIVLDQHFNSPEDRESATGRAQRAWQAFRVGAFDAAIEEAESSLQITRNGEAIAIMALSHARLGHHERAEELCRSALASSPRLKSFYAFFGEYFEKRDPAVAEGLIRLGLSLFPNYDALVLCLWRLLMEQGRQEEIVPFVRSLATQFPTTGHCHALAVICRITNRINEGIEAGFKAIELGIAQGNAHGNVFANLGRLLMAAGRHSEAAGAFETAVCVTNPDWSILSDMIIAFRLAGRLDKAVEWQEKMAQTGLNIVVGGLTPYGEDYAALDPEKPSNINRWHKTKTVKYFPLNFPAMPSIKDMIAEGILKDMPPYPRMFDASSRIITFGSCFAREIRKALYERGIPSASVAVPESLNNSFALRYFIEWCLTGRRSDNTYWYDEDPKLGAFQWEAPEEQSHYAEMFKKANGIVLTLGLAEMWRDRVTGGVFWRGVPEHIFDMDRHEVVLSDPLQNAENLGAIIELVRAECGEVPIILTVSPIPLNATFREQACLVADAASKSILRAAVEMVMLKKFSNVYYWPSFEIVRWMGAHLKTPTFGFPGESVSPRHVPKPVIDGIVTAFLERFFTDVT